MKTKNKSIETTITIKCNISKIIKMCYSGVVSPNLFHSEESFENLKNISEALKVPQGDQVFRTILVGKTEAGSVGQNWMAE